MNNDPKTSLITFLVSENDRRLISEKMREASISNLSAYLRKMAIDGYIIKAELPDLDDIRSHIKKTSVNINQIAKRVNATGNIYAEDMFEIKKSQSEIYEQFDKILIKLSTLT